MNRRLATIVIALSSIAASRSLAQQTPGAMADSLLRRGQLDRAESLLYAEARKRPRDPQARYALGLYLWSRGAPRIAATLFDEAKQFGAPKEFIDYPLSRIYWDLGDYAAIAKLGGGDANDRAFINWLVAHPATITAPDSNVLVAFSRTSVEGYMGAVRLRVNGQPIVAQIWARGSCGLRISDTSAIVKKLHTFGKPREDSTHSLPAVADSIGFGRMSMTNQPVIAMKLRDGVQATLCFGEMMKYAPTFDPKAGLMTLHLGGRVPPPAPTSTQFRFFVMMDGIFSILRAGGLLPIVMPEVSSMLRDHRWTIDTRRGVLVVEQ